MDEEAMALGIIRPDEVVEKDTTDHKEDIPIYRYDYNSVAPEYRTNYQHR